MAADPGFTAIDDHDLAMIAEIELEAIAPTPSGIEGSDFHASGGQLPVEICTRKSTAAYLVIQQKDCNACSRLVSQQAADAPAKIVVADNIELE